MCDVQEVVIHDQAASDIVLIKALSRVMATTEQLRLLQIAQRGAERELNKQQGLAYPTLPSRAVSALRLRTRGRAGADAART